MPCSVTSFIVSACINAGLAFAIRIEPQTDSSADSFGLEDSPIAPRIVCAVLPEMPRLDRVELTPDKVEPIEDQLTPMRNPFRLTELREKKRQRPWPRRQRLAPAAPRCTRLARQSCCWRRNSWPRRTHSAQ